MVRCSLCLTPCADSTSSIVAEGQTFHKDCFRCLRCQRQLTLDHYQLISLGPVCPDGTCSAQRGSGGGASTSTPTSTKSRNRIPVWTEEFDEEGDPYYFNHVTGDSLWEKPDDFETAEMIESDEESDFYSDDEEYKEMSNGVSSSSSPLNSMSDAERQRQREELLRQEREAMEEGERMKKQAMERASRMREAERKAREREEAARRDEAERRRLEEAEEEERRRRRELAAEKTKQAQAQEEEQRRKSEAARKREREKEEARLKKEKQKKRDQEKKESDKRQARARDDRDKKRANLEKLFSAEVNKKKSQIDNNTKAGINSSYQIEKQRQQEFKRKLGKDKSGASDNDLTKVKTRRKAPSSPPQPKPAASMTMGSGGPGSGMSGPGGGGGDDDLVALFARLGIGDKHLDRFIAEEMAVRDVLLLSPEELEELLPTKGPRVRLSKFIADQRLKNELQFLVRGEYFKKIVTFGASRRRLIFCNESLTSLVWAENPNRIKGALERLVSIIPGDPATKSGSLQFTATGVVSGKKRSLLLQADTVETQQKWVSGLQKALDINANR